LADDDVAWAGVADGRSAFIFIVHSGLSMGI
jgi:hypothetical protein